MEKIEIMKYEDFCEDEFTKLIEGEKTGVLKLAVPVANVNEWHGNRPSPYSIIAGISFIIPYSVDPYPLSSCSRVPCQVLWLHDKAPDMSLSLFDK